MAPISVCLQDGRIDRHDGRAGKRKGREGKSTRKVLVKLVYWYQVAVCSDGLTLTFNKAFIEGVLVFLWVVL